jgi:hypothetical protein
MSLLQIQSEFSVYHWSCPGSSSVLTTQIDKELFIMWIMEKSAVLYTVGPWGLTVSMRRACRDSASWLITQDIQAFYGSCIITSWLVELCDSLITVGIQSLRMTNGWFKDKAPDLHSVDIKHLKIQEQIIWTLLSQNSREWKTEGKTDWKKNCG